MYNLQIYTEKTTSALPGLLMMRYMSSLYLVIRKMTIKMSFINVYSHTCFCLFFLVNLDV